MHIIKNKATVQNSKSEYFIQVTKIKVNDKKKFSSLMRKKIDFRDKITDKKDFWLGIYIYFKIFFGEMSFQ